MTNTPSNKPSFSNPVNYVDMREILAEEKREKEAEWNRLHELGFTEFEEMLCLGMLKRHEMTYEQIGAQFWPVRTRPQISKFAIAHGIRARIRGPATAWTRERDAIIRDNYGKIPIATLAAMLNCAIQSVRQRASILKVVSEMGRPLKGFKDIKLADRFEPYDRA